MTFDQDGEVIGLVEEVTAYVPNELYAFNMDAEPFTGSVEVRFSVIDSSKSALLAITKVNGRHIIWDAILALFKPVMADEAQMQYELLKQVVESN